MREYSSGLKSYLNGGHNLSKLDNLFLLGTEVGKKLEKKKDSRKGITTPCRENTHKPKEQPYSFFILLKLRSWLHQTC